MRKTKQPSDLKALFLWTTCFVAFAVLWLTYLVSSIHKEFNVKKDFSVLQKPPAVHPALFARYDPQHSGYLEVMYVCPPSMTTDPEEYDRSLVNMINNVNKITCVYPEKK